MSWLSYEFMRNALLAILLISPVFALFGTVVIRDKLSFFSDILGHSALTGVAVSIFLGLGSPMWLMVMLAVMISVFISILRWTNRGAIDSILGVMFSFVTSLGVVLLSRGGGFSKFTSYLVGDIVIVSRDQIIVLALLFCVALLYWVFSNNWLVLISVNPLLARSRGVYVFFSETLFAVLLAVIVTLAIPLVGVLVVNSLLILPAASARNITRTVRGYTIVSIVISIFSGIMGLLISFYWSSATGATIALVGCGVYLLSMVLSVFTYRLR